jgi:hypothetical protein
LAVCVQRQERLISENPSARPVKYVTFARPCASASRASACFRSHISCFTSGHSAKSAGISSSSHASDSSLRISSFASQIFRCQIGQSTKSHGLTRGTYLPRRRLPVASKSASKMAAAIRRFRSSTRPWYAAARPFIQSSFSASATMSSAWNRPVCRYSRVRSSAATPPLRALRVRYFRAGQTSSDHRITVLNRSNPF